MGNYFVKHKIFQQTLLIIVLFLNACNSPQPVINELSNTTSTYDEIVHINNCGNKAESMQTVSRSFAVKTSGTGTLKAGYDKIVEGSISATYEQYKNTTKTQSLTAAPDTDMEFTLRWSDNVRAGNAAVNGENVNYNVNIPISVEQISSVDLKCKSETTSPQVIIVTATVAKPVVPVQQLEPQFDPNNPEGFLTWYFHEVWNSRNYDSLWTYLSDEFIQRRDLTFSAYKENWNKIGSIGEPIKIAYEGKSSGYSSYRVQYTTYSLVGNYPDRRNDLFNIYFNQDKDHWEFK